MKNLIFLSLLLFISPCLKAQEYLYDIGTNIGISSGYGDLNQSKLFYSPSLSSEIQLRYNYNYRWVLTGMALTEGLKGDTKDFDNVFPDNKQYSYDNRLWGIAFGGEFNFFNYGWGNDYRNLSRFTPFLGVGIGLGIVNAKENTPFAFSLPLSAGLKYKLTRRINLCMKVVFAKMLTDKADDIDDPYGIESSFLKNTDWYSSFSLGLSFEFGHRLRKCNNLD
ncbi:MAG: DUF6089 family protein [Bacteroidales bacterium]|nr:DUF6089 family protein [Bacteroidales bacterium]